jgi:hypothetical protein
MLSVSNGISIVQNARCTARAALAEQKFNTQHLENSKHYTLHGQVETE